MNKVLIALLTGVAVGVLIAPAKGSETRKKLQKNFDDLADGLDRLIDSEKRMVKNAVKTINETNAKLAEQAM